MRLRDGGHEVIGYDPRPEVSDVLTLAALADALVPSRVIWVMVRTNGTVVRSWLQQLLAKALKEDPKLAEITGYTDDSGEGRWTVEEAIRLRVPVPSIAASLFARFLSRQHDSPTMKAVAALPNQFGGHAVQRVSQSG